MQRVLSAVSSTRPRGTRVRLAVLLFFHFIIFVQGWSFDNPHVPVSFCQTPRDCTGEEWTDPLPTCENFRCVCPSGTCVVYTNGKSNYLFFCGSCGMLGSVCNDTTDCTMDWRCERGFCECDIGSVHNGVCLYYESTSSIAVTTVVFISILIFLIIFQNLIRSRKKLKKLCCRSCNSSYESDDDQLSRIIASNPQSNEKSAAFTIANSDFITTEEDPDLAWAFELSRRLAEGGELDAATLSSTLTSLPRYDPRFTDPSPPQPGTSEWREPRSEARSQRRLSNSSLSSTSSSQHDSSSSSSFDTASSYSSTLPPRITVLIPRL